MTRYQDTERVAAQLERKANWASFCRKTPTGMIRRVRLMIRRQAT